MARKKLSARAARREQERSIERLGRDMERLALLEPGGAPERPIPLESASQVEPAARDLPCPRCQARRVVHGEGPARPSPSSAPAPPVTSAAPSAVRVEEHAAVTLGGARLRVAHVACAACGLRRAIYFRLGGDALN